jgi:hypothetical protein
LIGVRDQIANDPRYHPTPDVRYDPDIADIITLRNVAQQARKRLRTVPPGRQGDTLALAEILETFFGNWGYWGYWHPITGANQKPGGL